MSVIGGPFNGVDMMNSLSGMRGANGPEKGEGAKKAARLGKAVNDFEGLFVNNMLKTMRSTIQKSGLLGDGMGEDIYTSLFDWEISKEMAAGGGLGLGRILLKQINNHEANEGKAGTLRQGPLLKKKE